MDDGAHLRKLLGARAKDAAFYDGVRAVCTPFINVAPRAVRGGRSRLNCAPELPLDTPWPERHGRPYRCLCQLDLSELAGHPTLLPQAGLLTIFYQHEGYGIFGDDDQEQLWWEPGFVHILYVPPGTATKRVAQPPRLAFGPAVAVHLVPTLEPERDRDDELLSDDCPLRYYELVELFWKLHTGRMFLLGKPLNLTFPTNTTEPGWVLLFNASTVDTLEWCWSDGDRLSVFIEHKRLKKLDFSNLYVTAG